MYDLIINIGRFQPPHLAHEEMLKEARKLAKKQLICVGSSNRSRSILNPWTYQERRSIIHDILWDITGVHIVPLNDYVYNDEAWIINLQKIVDSTLELFDINTNAKIALFGGDKDDSSYYLKLFPQWDVIEFKSKAFPKLSATDIRDSYFQKGADLPIPTCSDIVCNALKRFKRHWSFQNILAEAEDVRAYKKSWSSVPFPPTFNTVDAVVIQGGHILLVERGGPLGKGLLAMPGGFIHADETLLDAMIRELKEETKVSDRFGEIPPAILKTFVTHHETFDDPRRSARGRTITTAFLLKLPSGVITKIKGSDDAVKAEWYEIGKLKAEAFFEDHAFVIGKMLGVTLD